MVKKSDSILRLLLQGADREKYGRQGAVASKAAIEEEVQRRVAIEREKMRLENGRMTVAELKVEILRKLEIVHKRKLLEGRIVGR